MLTINLARPRHEWVTTGCTTKHGDPRGWKLHAIAATPGTSIKSVAWKRSACGHIARWGGDLFIEKKCAQCLRALGLACPLCRGIGWIDGVFCAPCAGTGEGEEERARERARAIVERRRENARGIAEMAAEDASLSA